MHHTVTVMTYNLWGEWDLPTRSEPLGELMRRRQPDLLGVQELHPQLRTIIDEALPNHSRVHGDEPGWATRSNLWWNTTVFEIEESGTRDVGILHEDSLLFWAKLRSIVLPDAPSVLLAAAHLTFPGHPLERETERSPRTEQAAAVGEALTELSPDGATFLCIDINDYARPLWALYDRGYREPFGTLGRTSPITHPVTPRHDKPPPWEGVQTVEKAIDWIFYRGPAQPRTAEVVEFFHEGTAPSDHKPVMATFALTDPATPTPAVQTEKGGAR